MKQDLQVKKTLGKMDQGEFNQHALLHHRAVLHANSDVKDAQPAGQGSASKISGTKHKFCDVNTQVQEGQYRAQAARKYALLKRV